MEVLNSQEVRAASIHVWKIIFIAINMEQLISEASNPSEQFLPLKVQTIPKPKQFE